RVQLRKLPEWVALRRRNATILNSRLSSVLRVPVPAIGLEHAYYRWYGYLDRPLKDGWTRERVCDTISERGVWCQVGSCSEIYLEKAFDGTGYRPASRLPIARDMGESSVCLLVHPTLSEENVNEMADVVESVLADSIQ
ncbi:MAG: DegT/DnrJ/EryC1/StrS family aminotransferase, partial [Fimbriimonadaceae bacterium]